MNSNTGIIAGRGDLPILLAKAIIAKGHTPVVAALQGFANIEDFSFCNHASFKIGAVRKIFAFFQNYNITSLIFAGKVERPKWRDLKVDGLGAALVGTILKKQLLGDDSIMQSIAHFVNQHGFNVIPFCDYLSKPYALGALGQLTPDNNDLQDIAIARELIKAISSFDVGHCVIVEQKTILGIEGLEGTNGLIARCSSLKKAALRQGVLIKMAKQGQNLALDPPVIGPETIKNLANAGFKGLAIEQATVIVIDIAQVIKLANELNIFIWVI